jgi:hypothetical protein
MKKTFILMAAAVAMLAACNGNKNAKTAAAQDSTATASDTNDTTTQAGSDSLVYEGMTPAADCEGIRYRIAMDAQKKNFTAKEDYMETETQVKNTFYEKGTIAPYTKNGKKGLKFSTGKDDALYFVTVGDSTLRMVNAELEEAVSGNYDLKLK